VKVLRFFAAWALPAPDRPGTFSRPTTSNATAVNGGGHSSTGLDGRGTSLLHKSGVQPDGSAGNAWSSTDMTEDDLASSLASLRLAREVVPFAVHYYLADDTVEVVEVHRRNSGRDPFPCLLRRCKLPKATPEVGGFSLPEMLAFHSVQLVST
jgi:hypothetical protein